MKKINILVLLIFSIMVVLFPALVYARENTFDIDVPVEKNEAVESTLPVSRDINEKQGLTERVRNESKVQSNGLIWGLEGNTLTISGHGGILSYFLDENNIKDEKIEKIVIESGITSIGADAFSGCSSLSSITIPDGVTHIGRNAFYDCNNLSSVTIPDSVTDIGEGAFSGCRGLNGITIPSSVTYIGKGAFRDCSQLTDIYYGGTPLGWIELTDSDKTFAFKGNKDFSFATVHYVNVPWKLERNTLTISGIETITSDFLENNCIQNVGKIIIGPGVKSIGRYAFRFVRTDNVIILKNDKFYQKALCRLSYKW